MLKVLHTGDWHIGSFPGPEVGGQNARFQDICRCLDFQAMYAEEHRPDLIVVSGDIFHQARVWSDRGLRESRTAIDHIRRLSNVAPTVVLRGTPNHDSEEQFEMLTTAFYGDDSVSVVTEPEVIHIHTYHGQRVDVACIPGFDRGVHRAAHPGLSREEETQVFTDELAKVVLGLKAQCEPGVTSILSTHFTVPGCNMESGQTALFAQFEPVIYPDTLKAADFDLVALGHIHRPQQLPEAGRAVFYCGSITGLNFNDEGQPRGFYMRMEKTLKSNSKKEVTALDIIVNDAATGALPYMSRSGGERVKAALSVILALAELKSSTAGVQLGFLFIDEPPFLDDKGVQAYCDALEAIQKRYSSLKIMAITHDPEMKARFPQAVDVVKTAEGSKVIYS